MTTIIMGNELNNLNDMPMHDLLC